MKTENKQYKLKRWYPSLDRRIEKGDIATWDGQHYRIVKEYQQYEDCGLTEEWYHFVKDEVENNPDFWELIEEEKPKPLFITEDGVEVFEISTQKMFVVRLSDCEKFIFDTSVWSNISNESKVYYHESNADEYIWRNKRLFSYEDIREYFECEGKFYDVKSIAKERAEQ